MRAASIVPAACVGSCTTQPAPPDATADAGVAPLADAGPVPDAPAGCEEMTPDQCGAPRECVDSVVRGCTCCAPTLPRCEPTQVCCRAYQAAARRGAERCAWLAAMTCDDVRSTICPPGGVR